MSLRRALPSKSSLPHLRLISLPHHSRRFPRRLSSQTTSSQNEAATPPQPRPKFVHNARPPLNLSVPSVTYPYSRHGPLREDNIIISSSTKPSNLINALTSLLSESAPPNTTHEPKSFGSGHWRLDLHQHHTAYASDGIYRHLALKTKEEADAVVAAVNRAADEMDHHPQIARADPHADSGKAWLVTILCTTHNPPGLSLRDVRLATEINKILAPYSHRYGVWEKLDQLGPRHVSHRSTLKRWRFYMLLRANGRMPGLKPPAGWTDGA